MKPIGQNADRVTADDWEDARSKSAKEEHGVEPTDVWMDIKVRARCSIALALFLANHLRFFANHSFSNLGEQKSKAEAERRHARKHDEDASVCEEDESSVFIT